MDYMAARFLVEAIQVTASRLVQLWLLAAVLMLIPSVFSDGHETSIGVGVMFLILGIVFVSGERSS